MLHDISGQSTQSLMTDLGLKAQANESVKLPEPESFFCYEEGHKDRQRMVSYSDIVI